YSAPGVLSHADNRCPGLCASALRCAWTQSHRRGGAESARLRGKGRAGAGADLEKHRKGFAAHAWRQRELSRSFSARATEQNRLRAVPARRNKAAKWFFES